MPGRRIVQFVLYNLVHKVNIGRRSRNVQLEHRPNRNSRSLISVESSSTIGMFISILNQQVRSEVETLNRFRLNCIPFKNDSFNLLHLFEPTPVQTVFCSILQEVLYNVPLCNCKMIDPAALKLIFRFRNDEICLIASFNKCGPHWSR